MLVKRLILIVISLVLGYVLTFGVITFFGETLNKFGPWYTGFTTFALACAVGIWLDKFMGTEILPK
jgi:hypothetical protein